MKQLIFNNSRSLKLTNVLIFQDTFESDNFDVMINKINNFLVMNGASQIGPIIQHNFLVNDDDNPVRMEFMIQCNKFIHKIEYPFRMESIIRVKNCVYCRYSGPEKMQRIGCDKIKVEAFENDIELTGNTYTVYVESNEENGTVVTDFFMERKN